MTDINRLRAAEIFYEACNKKYEKENTKPKIRDNLKTNKYIGT